MFLFFLQYPYIFCNILILTRIVQGDIICGWDGRETLENCNLECYNLSRVDKLTKI